jgi:hypothetical protein
MTRGALARAASRRWSEATAHSADNGGNVMKNDSVLLKRFLASTTTTLCVASLTLATSALAADAMEAAPAAPAEAVQTGTVKGDHLNVRATPALTGEIITHLMKGDVVTVLEVKKSGADANQDWARIALPPSARVYVFKDFISDGAVKAAQLNVRSGPSLDHAVVGRLKMGAKVEPLETKGEWVAIKAPPGTSGWVSAQYVELNPIEPVGQPRGPEPSLTTTPARDEPLPTVPGEKEIETIVREGMIKVGTLQKADAEVFGDATHQLYVQGKESRDFTLCYVKFVNPNIIPARYENKLVKIRGREIWERGQRCPIMEVAQIDKVW